MKLDIINPITGVTEKSSYGVCDRISSVEIVPESISSVVRLHNYRSHIGVSKTKNRSDVSGSGKKPHRQKGTGRARCGSIRSPLWRKGGVIFGGLKLAKTFMVNLPKKVRSSCFDMILKSRILEGNLMIINDFNYSFNSVNISLDFLSLISSKRCLFVVDTSFSLDFMKKIANFPKVNLVDCSFVNVHDILKSDFVLVSKSVFDKWNYVNLEVS